jgi:hypothetical protein
MLLSGNTIQWMNRDSRIPWVSTTQIGERGLATRGAQRMGRIEENSFLCRKCASANWEKISAGGMPGEPVMDLLLFEVSDVIKERQWRELSQNSIFAWNDLHPLREMSKSTRNSCVVSHGNGELRRENAWQSSDGREKSIASGRHCFTQVLLGQPVGLQCELINCVTFDSINKNRVVFMPFCREWRVCDSQNEKNV